MDRVYYQIVSQVLVVLALICVITLGRRCDNVCLLLVSPASYLIHRGIFYSCVLLDVVIPILYSEWSAIVVLHGHILILSMLIYLVVLRNNARKRKCL